MNYFIRKAEYEDLPLFVDLCTAMINENKLPFKSGGEVCVENCVRDFFRSPDGVCWIAISGDSASQYHNKVIGWIFASCGTYTFSDEPIAAIRGWDVAPEFRTVGVGGRLFNKVKEWAKERSRILTVGVNIDSSSTPEIAFNKVKSLGFKEFERTFYLKLDEEE